jgi:bifunctional non-homologous end joining protein LigD
VIAEEFWKQGPQLAEPSKTVASTPVQAIDTLQRKGYQFELKFDGVRSFAYVSDGTVNLINRRGADITFRYPEIVDRLVQMYPEGDYVLDGEILVWGSDGKPDFAAIHRRDAQATASASMLLTQQFPASFVAFDVLLIDGHDMRSQPYMARSQWLKAENSRWGQVSARPNMLMAGVQSLNGVAMWDHVVAQGMEGLIAKAPHGRYRAGRHADWVKLKVTFTASFVVVGYTAGKGRRANGIGALQLALIGPSGPVETGEVGTGFTDRDLDLLKPRIDAGELLVSEVEFSNVVAANNKLRFPSWKGLRDDVEPTDCLLSQLDGVPRY